MDSHAPRLRSATPGKGEGPTESYKERATRYRAAEVHSLRAAVKALEDEISQMRTSHSDSDSAWHLVENRSAAGWAAHERELGHGMGSLVAQAEEASRERGGPRDALMESLYAVKRAELEAVIKCHTLEDELLAAKPKIQRCEGRSVPLPPLPGVAQCDESVLELGEFSDGNGDLKPAAVATSSASPVHPAMVSTPAPATSFVAAFQAKVYAVVEGEGSHSSDDSLGLCVHADHGGSDPGYDARLEESSEHSIHDSSGRQRVMYLQQAKPDAPLHAGLNADVWRRGVYDPSSRSVRLDDSATTMGAALVV